MPESRAAQRPTEPGRGGLGSIWGGHPGDGLGAHGNYKTKRDRRQQPVFCSSTEDDPRSRWSGLPPGAQQVSVGTWGQRVQDRSLEREWPMWGNGDLCTQLNRTRKSGPKFDLQRMMLDSSGKRWSAISATHCTSGTSSGVSLGRACLQAELGPGILRN